MNELVDFLTNSRADIRQAAVGLVLGLTSDDVSLHQLIQAGTIKPLCRLLGDVRCIAEPAIKALINITAAQPEASETTLKYDIINRICNQLELPEWRLKNLSLMILANVTITEAGSTAMVTDPKYSERSLLLLQKLTSIFLETVPEPDGKDEVSEEPIWDDEYQYVANILANITQVKEGREFLRSSGRQNVPLLKVLVPEMHSANVIRRRGITNMFRNVAFDTEEHAMLFEDLDIVTDAMVLLCGPEELSDDDKDGMPVRVYAAGARKVREADEIVRAAVVDLLLLFCATRAGRDCLRSRKLYPIVRDAHLVEENDEIGEQIYKLVGFLMRDEEGDEPDWDEISKKSFSRNDDKKESVKKKVEQSTSKPEVPKPSKMVNTTETEVEKEEDISDDIADMLAREIEAINPDSDSEDDLAALD